MRNKGFVIFLTTAVTVLCTYYLSFSWVTARVEREAITHATDEEGNLDYAKKQAYLNAAWKKPVHKLLGTSFTYEEVKEKSLALGLDLQGGMHVTLEVAPAALIQELARQKKDPVLLEALAAAGKKQQTQPKTPFTKLFYQAFQRQQPGGTLRKFFVTAANKARLGGKTDDAAILKMLQQEVDSAISRSTQIISSRIDQFGTTQPNIQQLPGTGRIQVELPGVSNAKRIRNILQSAAKLSFWPVYDQQDLTPALNAVDNLLIKEQTARAQRSTTDSTVEENKEVLNVSPLQGRHGRWHYHIDEKTKIDAILTRKDIQALLPNDLHLCWGVKPSGEHYTLYPLRRKHRSGALLEGDVVTDAQYTFNENRQHAVSMQMNTQGARAWRRITAAHVGKPIAVVLDSRVYTAPNISEEIPNGSSQISGQFTAEEAKDLANVLKAGSLPAPVKIVEEAIVGPTLGKAAQEQGLLSMLIGLGLVILFMLMYYAQAGMVANLALLFNMLFVLGVLAQLGAALTLPGIAGIVLTIGMSVDANVLIFERIREELNRDMPIRAAIQAGYEKAFSSIFDSNLTTLIVGAVLYWLGQGPLKGFATTLMVGIISSFFTAVFITRLLLTWMSRKGKTISFSFAYSHNPLGHLTINFLRLRKVAYLISFLFIGTGFGCIVAQKGLNLGVDFTGGRSYVVQFHHPVKDPVALKNQLLQKNFDQKGTEVKTYGANNTLKITTSYCSKDASNAADAQVRSALIRGITAHTGHQYTDDHTATPPKGKFTIVSTAKVGATVASDIKTSSQKAMWLALILIFLYILMRFRRWQFGLASVLALFHDSLAVVAGFGIARALGFSYEVDQVFVAAILTVIGYSINDTVVVFDRIREHLKERSRTALRNVANPAINETMSRTLITSLTTFIAVATLLIFGGEALRGFSFAMLLGIVFGTYSSICIATPLAIDLSSEPKNKQR